MTLNLRHEAGVGIDNTLLVDGQRVDPEELIDNLYRLVRAADAMLPRLPVDDTRDQSALRDALSPFTFETP